MRETTKVDARSFPARAALACAAAAAAALGAAACGGNDFTLSSPDIPSGGTIKQEQVFTGCGGGNVSPELRWSNPPAGTKSFAITMHDPDAPTGSGFWHWTVFDLPASARSLAKGQSGSGVSGSSGTQGVTDFGSNGYGGPCPPSGDDAHHYTITLYALKVDTLGIPAGAPGALVSFNAKANALGQASFTATYGISPAGQKHPDAATVNGFTLTSSDIPSGGTIPAAQVFDAFGCTGQNKSPALSWAGAPAGTQSLVLTVFDGDAPTGSGFWHWLVYDLPGAPSGTIPTGAGAGASPGGGKQGYTDYGQSVYGGPCPPVGDPAHHYTFTLYALDVPNLGIAPGPTSPTGAFVSFSTRTSGHMLGKATFTATYGR